MSKGARGLLAPWLGGAAKPHVTTVRGVRSVQAFWMGGGAKPPPASTVRGVRGMAHFWMGGSAVPFVTPEPPQPPDQGGVIPSKPRYEFKVRPHRLRDDEEIFAVILAFLHTVNDH